MQGSEGGNTMTNREWIEQCLGRLDKEAGFKVSLVSEDENFRIFGMENEYEFWKEPLKIACKEVHPENVKKGDLAIWYNGITPQKIVRITGFGEKEKEYPNDETMMCGLYGETLSEDKGSVHFGCYEDCYVTIICMDETEKLFEAEKQS